MTEYPAVQAERRRRRDLDKMASEGARRRPWSLEARDSGDGLVVWVLPNWTATW